MIRFSRLLLALTLTGMVTLPCVAAPDVRSAGLAAAAAVDRDDDDEYVSAEGFSIVPPEGWEEGEGSSDKTIMVYLGPVEGQFRPNFNVNVSADDGTSVDELADIIKPEYAKAFQKWKMMYDGTTTIGDEDAYYISSSFTMNGKNIQNLQYFIHGKNKRFYVLTFTSVADKFKKYEPIFKAAAESVETTDD